MAGFTSTGLGASLGLCYSYFALTTGNTTFLGAVF